MLNRMEAGIRKLAIYIGIISLLMAALLSGCSGNRNETNLSDLGGVYSVRERDIDFSDEITESLTEPVSGINTEEGAVESINPVTDGIYDNKTLRWGLKRRSAGAVPDTNPGAVKLLKKYGGLYVGDINKKVIYLTFDEGYENGYTVKILDVLRDNSAKGVFFITGPYLREHQDLVRRMVEEGHTVGNHTIHHPSLPEKTDEVVEEEVLGLDRAFNEKFGKHMRFLRPPKGEFSERTLALTYKLGYCNLFWSFAYEDWNKDKQRGAEYAYEKVMSNLHNGAVILLHAVSKDNAEALDKIIKDAKALGYEIGNLEELKIENVQ